MTIPTEPIGSIPRPLELVRAQAEFAAGKLGRDEFLAVRDRAVLDTVARFERTGSPVITDGEQCKSSFATYPLEGLKNLHGDGVVIPFADGHTRRLPRLTSGPFAYGSYAATCLDRAKAVTRLPIKQAVISASALSLIYPVDGIVDYPREQFLKDLVAAARADIQRSFRAGAYNVQIDFTEARLSLKLDPSKKLLRDFVELNNRVVEAFGPEEKKKLGVHVCPGGDQDSTHSADVDAVPLVQELFSLDVTNFYVQLASERDPVRVLTAIRKVLKPHQRVFVGVIDPIDPVIERPEIVKMRVIEAAKYIPVEQLGTCDDCGFSPFSDDTSTSRDIAFGKIASRVEGTRLASVPLAA